MTSLSPALLVGAGGMLGALARHLVGTYVETGQRDTLAVNVVGSFLLGMLVSASLDESVLLVFGTGFCGAFTTFSSFAVETVRLFETGERRQATFNAGSNLIGALTAVILGSVLIETFV